MKLLRFAVDDSKPGFGVVIGDRAVTFVSLMHERGTYYKTTMYGS